MKVTSGQISDEARRQGHHTKQANTDLQLLTAAAELWLKIARDQPSSISPPTKTDIERKADRSRAVWRVSDRSPDQLRDTLAAWGSAVVDDRTLMPRDRVPDCASGSPFSSTVLGLAPQDFLLAAAAARFHQASTWERIRADLDDEAQGNEGSVTKAEIMAHKLYGESARIAAGAFEVAAKSQAQPPLDFDALEHCRFWAGSASENLLDPDQRWSIRIDAFLAAAQHGLPAEVWPPEGAYALESVEGFIDGAIRGGRFEFLVSTLRELDESASEVDWSVMTPVEYAMERLALRDLDGNPAVRASVRKAANRLTEHHVNRACDPWISRRITAFKDYLSAADKDNPERASRYLSTLEDVLLSAPARPISRLGELDHQMGALSLIAHEAALKSRQAEEAAEWIEWHLARRWAAGEGPFMEPEVRDLASQCESYGIDQEAALVDVLRGLRQRVWEVSVLVAIERVFGSEPPGIRELREVAADLRAELDSLG